MILKRSNILFMGLISFCPALYAMEDGTAEMIDILIFQRESSQTQSQTVTPTVSTGAKIVDQSKPGVQPTPIGKVTTPAPSVPASKPAEKMPTSQAALNNPTPCPKQTPSSSSTSSTNTASNKPQFSFMAGIKKGFNYLICPITSHPYICALLASGGFVYALKKGYVKELLIKLGLSKKHPENVVSPVAQ